MLFFPEFSYPGRRWTEFGNKFFFFPFLGLPQPVLDRNNVGINFLFFLNFFAIFSQFSSPAEYERNSGLKFFSLFLGLSPVLAKNNAGIRFFNFLIFFFFFFLEFSFSDRVWTEFGNKIVFSLSWPISFPFWLKIMLECSFLILWIFLLFFSEFSYRGQVWTEFGYKIFCSFSQPISSRFG